MSVIVTIAKCLPCAVNNDSIGQTVDNAPGLLESNQSVCLFCLVLKDIMLPASTILKPLCLKQWWI